MDSYEILGVNKDSSDKEIEVAYLDLKRKYDPSFNTSIHAYKKYREILKAYENIKDEQRRRMYDLKDKEEKREVVNKTYELYDFDVAEESVKEEEIDYSKVEDFLVAAYRDIEVNVEVSYLYYLLNLRYDLEYYHQVKCKDCDDFITCHECDGKKVVKYKENLIYCPVCKGEGKVSVNCKTCGDTGFVVEKENISFYVDEIVKEFKGLGDEYSDNIKSNLKVIFNFYDKENIKVSEDKIEVNYYLNKEETVRGLNKEFFTEFGAFKLEIPSFVENGHKEEIIFNNKKIIFTFLNEKYDGKDKEMYLFINRHYKNKFIYFNEDYSICSEEEKIDCNVMVKCSSKILVENKGEAGKYDGSNGNLIINVIFNGDDDLLYVDNVKVLHTSKLFNVLGGKVEDIIHYGFKKDNALIKRKDGYYLLTGDSSNKAKLKNYFIFKVLSVFLWCMLPILMLVIPYGQTMFIVFLSVMFAYFIISNILMELEV